MKQRRDVYHHGDLRNALVASAVRLIETDGPAAFSLRAAAREVGVSANAAYRHFDDKSALMAAVAAEGFARLATRMRRSMAGSPLRRAAEPEPIARFKAVGRAYVGFAADHPEMFRVMFGEDGAAYRFGEPSAPWMLLAQSLDALVVGGFLTPERRPGAEMKAWVVVHGLACLTLEGLGLAPTRRGRAAALESLLQFTVIGLCGEIRGAVQSHSM